MRYTRMCLRLWSFRHSAGDTIDYSVDTHPVGLELRVSLNRQLLHSEVYRDPEALMQSAERGRDRLEARGWTMSSMEKES
jgi:hypothetical protein